MAPLMYINIIRVRTRQVWFVSDYTSVTMARAQRDCLLLFFYTTSTDSR